MSRRISILELRSVRGTGGGPEKTILLGADRRDRDRFDVTVCYIRDLRDDVFGIDDRAVRVEIDYVEVREKHSFDTGIWKPLVSLVRDRGIHIIHAHEYKTDLLALLLARRTGAIALSTAHGWTGHSGRERWLYYPLDKWLLARFPRVIAVSTDIKQELVRHGARPEAVTVILNSIDPGTFRRSGRRAAVREALGFDERQFVIGAVGRVEPQKRFDLLLQALARTFAAKPDVHLVIVGDGSMRGAIQMRANELGVAGQCHLVGHRQDIADLHEAFDLFVQSSDYEGTPNAVLEAMAMETPLVATAAGGTAELALDEVHGWIVPVGDVTALERAIVSAIERPDVARARAAAARARVETDLSFETRTRKLEQIYLELAGPVETR